MMQTTLRKVRAADPCGMRLENGQRFGYLKLRYHLGKGYGDDTPINIATILDSNGLDDALWCLRAVDGHAREMRLYAVWCARQVQSRLEDQRSLTALDVAERHANGAASNDELAAAWAAAWGARANAAYAARANAAAYDATYAARANAARANAAYAAAYDAAYAAAYAARANAAAYDATYAAYDAAYAAWAAAYAAADAGSSRATQAAELQRICAEIAAGRDPYPAAGVIA